MTSLYICETCKYSRMKINKTKFGDIQMYFCDKLNKFPIFTGNKEICWKENDIRKIIFDIRNKNGDFRSII